MGKRPCASHCYVPASVRFDVADIQNAVFGERFELAFSRMGTMFFANCARRRDPASCGRLG
jgi:hypothetical protein